jgi:hypothetical protein
MPVFIMLLIKKHNICLKTRKLKIKISLGTVAEEATTIKT